MNTWMFLSRATIPAETLRLEVERMGGYWLGEMNRGVLQRGDSAIYLDPYPTDYRRELEIEDLRSLERELGGAPSFALSIGLSHGGDPSKLAEQFGRVMIEKWGGVLRRQQ